MNNLDSYLHIIGIELLAIFGIIWLLLAEQSIKRTIGNMFMVLLGLMLAHGATHLLPNAIASFIYSSHHTFHSKKVVTIQPQAVSGVVGGALAPPTMHKYLHKFNH